MSRIRPTIAVCAASLLTWCLVACSQGSPREEASGASGTNESAAREERTMAMQLRSAAFTSGTTIPVEHTCEGRDVSPALSWSDLPQGTQSLALITDDPDAPAGTWVHWVMYDIPPSDSGLQASVPVGATLASGAKQGKNSSSRIGYSGPCPPRGHGRHRYFFKLYALDRKVDLAPSATKEELLRAMQGHILAEAQLMGTYSRQ